MTAQKISRRNSKFVERMKAELPPAIARKEVFRLLGGMVSPQTLANADRAGNGPAGAYRVGKAVVYQTDLLLDWIVKRYGVSPIADLKEHYRPQRKEGMSEEKPVGPHEA